MKLLIWENTNINNRVNFCIFEHFVRDRWDKIYLLFEKRIFDSLFLFLSLNPLPRVMFPWGWSTARVTRVDSVERKAGTERSIGVPPRARQLVPGAVSRRFACVDGATVLELVAEIFPRFEVEKRRRTTRNHGERGFRRRQIFKSHGTVKVFRFDSCNLVFRHRENWLFL